MAWSETRRTLGGSIVSPWERKLISPIASFDRLRVIDDRAERGPRAIAEETPVAIVHDGATYAVMMATPADLEDFALGFSLTEGVIASIDEVREIELETSELGIEARLWLKPGRAAQLAERRRSLAGPTGCGLCGIDSLALVRRPPAPPPALIAPLSPGDIRQAMAAIEPLQALGRQTHAVHAAGFWRNGDGLLLLREDDGRHNAMDKLAGAMAREALDPSGVLVLTSRVSVELVQKAAAMRVPVIAAVSAPTAMAIRAAETAGITIIAVARSDGFEVFSHPQRLTLTPNTETERLPN
jgi:FdhD protein